MTIFISARDLRQKITEILGKVGFGGDVVIVERSGKPMAAIIPVGMYQKQVAEREARFQIIDKIRHAQSGISPKQTKYDVQAAIARARKQSSS